MYLKTKDPTYQKFRQTIRDREAFNREDDKIKLPDHNKVWKANKALNDDLKKTILKAKVDEEKKLE